MRVLPEEEMKTVIHYLRIYVKSYAIVLPWQPNKSQTYYTWGFPSLHWFFIFIFGSKASYAQLTSI